MSRVNELIENHDGAMTPELAAQILDAADGDTSDELDSGGKPIPAQDQDDTSDEPEKPAVLNEDEMTAENAVLMAKDGKHTIDFNKLVEAREAARIAREEADQAKAEIARLQQEAQQRQDSGQQATNQDAQVALAQQAIDSGIDPAVFGDFSEAELAKGIDQLTTAKVSQAVKAALEEYENQRRAKDEALTAEDSHFKTIYASHPDADSIVESQEFASWTKGLSSFQRAGVEHVMQNGTAEEIIEVFGAFKGATGSPQPGKDSDVRATADKALAEAKPVIPNSLSDFPGGTGKGATAEDRAGQMTNGIDLLEAMEGWSQERIDEFMSRSI